MAHRILLEHSQSVAVVDDALPVVRALEGLRPTRAQSILRSYHPAGSRSNPPAYRIVPTGGAAVTPGSRAFTPCTYDGTPFRVPPPPNAPPGTPDPLGPPVTLDVVPLSTVPVGSGVHAPVNVASSGAWALGTVVGDATHVRVELLGGSSRQTVALGRRVTWIPVADLQGPAGVAIFAGGRAGYEGGFNDLPAVVLDAYLPLGRVRFRGADGTKFEAVGIGMLESFDLPLPDQADRVWIVQIADLSNMDPDPEPGEAFACVHLSFS